MNTLTIPKTITKGEELVVIPRKEYEGLLTYYFKEVEEIDLTSTQKYILAQARKNLSQGKFLTLNELKRKLGITN